MKYLLLLSLLLLGCKHDRPFFQSWISGEESCANFCYSGGQGYVGVIQDSMGTCICDNEEGHKVQKGYGLYLNNRCEDKK